MGDFYYHIDWENSKGEKEHDRIFLDFTEANWGQLRLKEKNLESAVRGIEVNDAWKNSIELHVWDRLLRRTYPGTKGPIRGDLG